MANKCIFAIVMSGIFLGTLQLSGAQELVARYYDVSDTKFSIEATSPRDRVREYTICKVVSFAEKKNVQNLSLSDPVYSGLAQGPKDWIVVNMTAYLNDNPNPSGNPKVDIADYARKCRQLWDWYH